MVAAYLRSDEAFDGVFLLGVRTTGIFCRPSCRARKPLPDNVEFFATAKEALFSGFRPCLKCKPLNSTDVPSWIRGLMDRIEMHPNGRIREHDLREMQLEPARVRRFFSRRYGLTFAAYQRARRLGYAFDRIRRGGKLDEAVFETGYGSHSGFREAFRNVFGRAPGQIRGGDWIRLDWIETPLGPMVAGATDEGVCLLEFSDRRMLEAELQTLRRRVKTGMAPANHRHFDTLRGQLADYFQGRLRRFTVPLWTPGTDFEQQVWRAVSGIPLGETRSYQEIARSVGRPTATRAVGRANGMNRVAILVPCHRVVGRAGALTGYGGGLWRKQRLLALETESKGAPRLSASRSN